MSGAVVLGASMGGLLAAAALAGAGDDVALVERDRLPDGVAHRKGVPQSHHLHGLHASGLDAMEQLLPGLTAELEDAGAVVLDVQGDVDWVVDGRLLTGGACGVRSRFVSRPLLEHLVRRRVLALPGVVLHAETVADGLVLSSDRARVEGVRCTGPDGQQRTLPAELVVDAAGRTGLTGRWLAAEGWAQPEEEVVDVDLQYATLVLRAPHARPTFIAADADTLRGAGLAPLEGDRWILTVAGVCGLRPPTDLDGMRAYLAAVGPARMVERLRDAEPLGPVSTTRYPSSRRRRYRPGRHLPAGLLPFGDALASFNPAYGQGMSVAAREAAALARLRRSRHLQRAFLKAADEAVDRAWQTAVFADLAMPQVVGRRTLQCRVANAYTSRVSAAAAVDPAVMASFLRVGLMLDGPEALLRPRVLTRVLRGSRRAPARAEGPLPVVPAQAAPVDRGTRRRDRAQG